MNEAGGGGTRARRRLRGFGAHLAAYFAVMAVLVGLNVFFSPENLWVLAPVVGWGAVLAVHAAYAMGLLDVFGGKLGGATVNRRGHKQIDERDDLMEARRYEKP